jgi:tRNA threonylcarbamoyladenosine modification (KEOPS) complex  Pcc1 subunit
MLDSILDSIEIEPINVPKRLAEIRINPKSTLIQLAGDIRLMRARLNSIFNS